MSCIFLTFISSEFFLLSLKSVLLRVFILKVFLIHNCCGVKSSKLSRWPWNISKIPLRQTYGQQQAVREDTLGSVRQMSTHWLGLMDIRTTSVDIRSSNNKWLSLGYISYRCLWLARGRTWWTFAPPVFIRRFNAAACTVYLPNWASSGLCFSGLLGEFEGLLGCEFFLQGKQMDGQDIEEVKRVIKCLSLYDNKCWLEKKLVRLKHKDLHF